VAETPKVRIILKIMEIIIGSDILDDTKIQIPPMSDIAAINEKITKNT